MTVKRMTSGDLLKQRNGFLIQKGYESKPIASSQVSLTMPDEQREILDHTLDDVGDRIPIIAGVFADASHDAAKLAKMSEAAGASALLVFPSNVLMMGGERRPEMVLSD